MYYVILRDFLKKIGVQGHLKILHNHKLVASWNKGNWNLKSGVTV